MMLKLYNFAEKTICHTLPYAVFVMAYYLTGRITDISASRIGILWTLFGGCLALPLGISYVPAVVFSKWFRWHYRNEFDWIREEAMDYRRYFGNLYYSIAVPVLCGVLVTSYFWLRC